MNWKKWVRQTHRWVSIAFVVSMIVAFVAIAQEDPADWLFYLPLLPLTLLLLTGLYLFALPYVVKWRGAR